MPRILVCEDEDESRIAVCHALNRYSEEHQVRIEQVIAASGEQLIARLDDRVDLILLDIGLPAISGMDAARYLRRQGVQTPIIFITSMTQFALEGYEVHAFGFLKKPLNYRQFEWQMNDALTLLTRSRGTAIPLQTGAKLEVINSGDVVYVEVFSHRIELHNRQGEVYQCSMPLSELEEKLQEFGFFRPHKSYLVNMEFIVRFLPQDVELSGGITLPVSRYRRKEFLEAYAAYKEL